ncbi:hypothetical protein [Micromonospora endolithica]|uniref:DUF3168 domain-containing protein n=1 Tax=Micromonospora endolithica TaxID=230091 RepID=A0A3A9YR47_9ACTN|nr:hypothetical protein [Micromonospora endolithica]RKN38453.1 hypothetical protein D7223_31095 [Micromonospora endolithica]TWJ23127.1 hypothetical protein JD76_03256 [Micromonospora endolithica]
MSLAGDRQAIAAALSTAPDVTGHAFRPATTRLREGDAWPLLGTLERGPGMSWAASWRVLVALPTDGVKSAEWVDSHYQDLVDALEGADVGFVDRIEPVTIPDGDAERYALQITMRSE